MLSYVVFNKNITQDIVILTPLYTSRSSVSVFFSAFKGTKVVPPQNFLHLHQLDENVWKINNL